MNGRATPIMTASLVIALVAVSTILVMAVQTSSLQAPSSSAATAHVHLVTPGVLVVNELPVFPSDPEPPSDQSFTILGSSGPSTPAKNGSGSFSLDLQPGAYILRISDPRFHLAIPFQILLGNVTVITILVVKHAVFPYFTDVSDADSSGWITNSSNILTGFFLPSIFVHQSDLAFIEVLNESGYSGIDSNATGRTIVAGVDPRGETIFVQLRALEEFRARSLAGSLVVIYDPTYSVKVN